MLAIQPQTEWHHLHPFICVPGTWANRAEFVSAVGARSGEWLVVGDALQNTVTREIVGWQMFDRDPDLVNAFLLAGRGQLTDEELTAIHEHAHQVYVYGCGNEGSLESAWTAMKAVSGLLDAGGIAVKVDTGGIVHTAAAWKALTAADDVAGLYQAYVAHVRDEKTLYTCGMRNLGCADAVISGVTPDEALRLLDGFLLYLLEGDAQVRDGDTMSLQSGSACYRLCLQPDARYPGDSPFHNPFGLWRLSVPAHHA